VSGDLVVASDSCPVQLSPGGNRAVRFTPGTNVGITVKVEAGAVVVGHCIPDPSSRRPNSCRVATVTDSEAARGSYLWIIARASGRDN